MHYIYIINDFLVTDQDKIKAEEIVKILLNKKIWVYTPSTPNLKKMQPEDKVVVYMAGEKRKKFVGYFEIAEDINKHNFNGNTEEEEYIFNLFPLAASIKNIQLFETPIYIKDIKNDLEFIKDKKNYGVFLRSSVRAVSEKDFERILIHTN
ncbi:EVE domain-containing protein [Priestia aryabhattai]|uniref:EVE domain-containing protein n=1 Tax=Priestia aryabhattai TaxID=412384 RepID=UPI0030C8FC9E